MDPAEPVQRTGDGAIFAAPATKVEGLPQPTIGIVVVVDREREEAGRPQHVGLVGLLDAQCQLLVKPAVPAVQRPFSACR